MENPNLNKPVHSVIMLIYHRTPELVEMALNCAASVRNSRPDNMEFIIVDNGSTVLHDWSKECDVYIRLSQNMGCGEGWNTGLRVAQGKYKTIIGDDVIVRPGWLEAMKEATDMPQAGMVNPHLQHLPQGVGIVEDYKWPSGACFMLTQRVIDRVGYFDSETYYPVNFEDHDYWTRILKAGFKIYKNHSMTIMHKEGSTVHAPDLSSHFRRLKEAFIKKHGFDNQDVFCGDKPFPF